MTRQKRYDAAMNAALRASEEIKGNAPEGEYLPWLYETTLSVLNFGQKECTDQGMRNLLEALTWSLMPHLRARLKAPGVVKQVSKYQQRLGIDAARHGLVERIRQYGFSLGQACEHAAELLDKHKHPAGGVDHTSIKKSHDRVEKDALQLPDEFWQLPGMLDLPELPDPAPMLERKPRT